MHVLPPASPPRPSRHRSGSRDRPNVGPPSAPAGRVETTRQPGPSSVRRVAVRAALARLRTRTLLRGAALLLGAVLLAPPGPTAAQERAREPIRVEGLGRLSFPSSGAAAAREPFLRGVLLLHSFEYGQAADAFRAAQEIDPDFALAYWGEAMTLTHPVWNEKDAEAGRAVLERLGPTRDARLARAPTDREKAYLSAVEVLYGEGGKARLDTLYELEMARLAGAYPWDLEARTFHALALLGLSQGNRDVATYMEAGAIALEAFAENPEHPGAAHYVIHSFDDPTHAVLAMDAARAYSRIAPDAAHALHMTTHIFLARGLWEEVVDQNLRALEVVNRERAGTGRPQTSCGHYAEWLLYGYQQQGRHDRAAELLGDCRARSLDHERSPDARAGAALSYLYMRALHLADARDRASDAAREPYPGGARGTAGDTRATGASGSSSVAPLVRAWGDGIVALAAGERAAAEEAHEYLARHTGEDLTPGWLARYAPVWRGTLRALLLADAGEPEAAVRAAREAAEHEASLPVDFGPPKAFRPARELEGELLLRSGRPEEAVTAFRRQLERTPNRILALGGLARSAAAAGHTELALRTYRTLAELLEEADRDHPERAEAAAFLSRRAGGGQ